MQVRLHETLADSLIARDAASALEACVHCGFCLATCPTYLDSRDERDSPRGRLYLLRELLEEGTASNAAQHHLDRCLTCRSCETTCPSGVRYGEIADAGRELLEERLPRRLKDRIMRWGLRTFVPRRRLFAGLLRTAQAVRPLLPGSIRKKVPERQHRLTVSSGRSTVSMGRRRVLLLEGCVQDAATPRTNAALRRILARIDVDVVESPAQGCCGALNTHLGAAEAGRDDMRRNIDAWSPMLDQGVEAVLVSATGCAAQLRSYAHALRGDPSYARRAATLSAAALDPVEYISELSVDLGGGQAGPLPRVALHAPCTQQHALRLGSQVADLLASVGYALCRVEDNHLCCGSAGTYSILQPDMSQRLRERKLAALSVDTPELIATANVGCQLHLQAEAQTPVRHWLELLDDAMAAAEKPIDGVDRAKNGTFL